MSTREGHRNVTTHRQPGDDGFLDVDGFQELRYHVGGTLDVENLTPRRTFTELG